MSARLRFLVLHSLSSLVIVLLIFLLIFFVWYPVPLIQAVGVLTIIFMMAVIDLIIGPLLGFLVYKEGKKSLKFDLTVIILLQLTALIYGVYNIEQGRPVWIVYNVDRFELVRKNDIVRTPTQEVKAEYEKTPWVPQWVACDFAKDINRRNEEMFAEAEVGISIARRPERYEPLKDAQQRILQQMQPLEKLKQFNATEAVEHILAQYPQATAWVPLDANVLDMVVLLDKQGHVIKMVDLRPWN